MKKLLVIGRAEKADIPQITDKKIPVKIDTGAKTSSIWAHKVKDTDAGLEVIFFGPKSNLYDGKVHLFDKGTYDITQITNSFGDVEFRYRLKLKIRLGRKLINGTFTLSDRGNMIYPVLIGRRLLLNKFIVDISKGNPDKGKECKKKRLFKEAVIKKKGQMNENSDSIKRAR